MENRIATDNESTKTDDEKEKEDLMKKFGFTENATWTALINKSNDERRSSIFGVESKKTGTDISNHLKSSHELTGSSENEDSESISQVSSNIYSKRKETETSKLSKALQRPHISRKNKIQILLKLVQAVNHNAGVYLEIGDISTFKVWIVIRDTLLWDLKKLDMLDENNITKGENGEHSSGESFIDSGYNQSPLSDDSPYSSKILSVEQESLSLIEEQPNALHDDDVVKRKHITTSKEQFQASENSANITSELLNQSQDENVDDKKSAVNDDNMKNNKSVRSQGEDDIFNKKGIPILKKREGRLSFIDTFMNDRRQLVGLADETASNRYSPPMVYSSPNSKISSLHSLTSGYLHGPFMHKMFSHMSSPPMIDSKVLLNKFLKETSTTSSIDEVCSNEKDISSHERSKDICMPPWDTATIIKQLYKQAIETGNTLLGINILLLFYNIYDIVPEEVVKNSLVEFITILHKFETFEIAAALLKSCPWDDIMGENSGRSSFIQIYCDKCHKLLVNEHSKEKFTIERNKQINRNDIEITEGNNGTDNKMDINIDPMTRFGYWYCDNCKKPNSLCVYCERPMKKLSIALLSCGHEGHFECFQEWFLDENMDVCPAGCNIELNL